MKRIAALLMGFAAFPAVATAQAAGPAADKTVEMKGVDIYLYSAGPSFGQLQDPTFWVHADRGESLDDTLWSIEGVQAVIYRAPEDDLVLAAATGTFDKGRKAAQLAGGVRVTSGTLVVDIDEIAWDETLRVARSESVATLNDGSNRIVGDAIAIFPDDDRVELGGGTATIQLAAAAELEKKPEDSTADKYQRLDIEEHHGTSGSLKGAPVQKIQGPVSMVLVGKDPADTLTIKADLVTMEYGSEPESRSPSRVALQGRVNIKQAKSEIQANEGTLDLAEGTAKFRGNVVFSGEGIANASGPSLDLNLDTGEWELGGPGGVISYDFSAPKPAKDKTP